jgi:hypothetical protein
MFKVSINEAIESASNGDVAKRREWGGAKQSMKTKQKTV